MGGGRGPKVAQFSAGPKTLNSNPICSTSHTCIVHAWIFPPMTFICCHSSFSKRLFHGRGLILAIDESCTFHNKEFVSNVRDDKGIWMCVQKCQPGGICSRWHFLIVLNFILFIIVCLLFRSQGTAKRCMYVKALWI